MYGGRPWSYLGDLAVCGEEDPGKGIRQAAVVCSEQTASLKLKKLISKVGLLTSEMLETLSICTSVELRSSGEVVSRISTAIENRRRALKDTPSPRPSFRSWCSSIRVYWRVEPYMLAQAGPKVNKVGSYGDIIDLIRVSYLDLQAFAERREQLGEDQLLVPNGFITAPLDRRLPLGTHEGAFFTFAMRLVFILGSPSARGPSDKQEESMEDKLSLPVPAGHNPAAEL
ncbi:hypothetical protein EYF80_025315 [Liparis tanakae]|uniref:Uncharacterized protein n=1 Tax=Liparis tanakae TaxID=230148 RepID=A0A4Z2HHT3_9TELE|nr:hypothetical protein EYF80_025315 [Liparis tanakae]